MLLLLIAALAPAGALDLRLGVDHLTQIADGETASAFELGRAELGARLNWDGLEAEARFETVRSAQPQSLFGIDRNSLIVRARWVRMGGGIDLGPVRLSGQAGLVADPFLDAVEDGFDLRDLSPLAAQTSGLLDQSDIGARLRVDALDARLGLEIAFANGEGATETERNDGVDTAVLVHGVPLRSALLGGSHVQVTGFWRDGSRGAGAVQNDRWGVGLTGRSPLGSVGLAYVMASGFNEQADRDASDLEAWANATVNRWLGVMGRFNRTELDTRVDAHRQSITAGLYLDPPLSGRAAQRRARLYVTWSRLTHGGGVGLDPAAIDRDTLFIRLTLMRDLPLGRAAGETPRGTP